MVKKNAIEVLSTVEFLELLQESGLFGRLMKEGQQVMTLFPFIMQDIFYALYLERPRVLELNRVSTGARLNRLIIEQLMKSRAYKKAHKYTKKNRIGTGIFTIHFAETLLSGLTAGIVETVNEISIVEEELANALNHRKAVEKVVQIADCEDRAEAAQLYQLSKEQWQRVELEKSRKLRSLAARLNLLWNTTAKEAGFGSGEDVKKQKNVQVESGSDGCGDNKGVWVRGDLSLHLKTAGIYGKSPKLQRLAQRLGRLKEVRALRGLGEMNADNEVQGVVYGNDLPVVVPEEWASYFDPEKRLQFQKKFIDEALCQYEMKEKSVRGKGSLIICLDNSGSMQGPKEETSKGIALGLMEIAMLQRRNFVIIMFGGPHDEMKSFEIKGGQCSFAQLVEIGEYFLCSAGTDFERPLKEALKYLEKDKYPDGDVVFITDGVCSVSTEFLEKYINHKKKKQFRTIGVLVNYGQVGTAPIAGFCDELLTSKDLKGLDVAESLFGKMRRG